ncbi:MAG: hypothetical protein A2289_25935 [Deltaproteobacteria bacterium RIFOXYA12_FULL_58_15]|nr:MAG: hypothetical protein A2289_25935 [Deltaproteobacteria bacterium RIFOXYA12_FULL_58_15]OGR11652.1 MAG: hypothetical protein A2341_02760 [Deltaproteobacteria bacterium RIFOXYB12_FULL_58_9]
MLKALELWGRHLLVGLVSLFFGVRRRPVDLPNAPRILVVRLDERIGNLLLLVPLLDTLRQRFPQGRIELLASVKGRALLDGHSCIDEIIPFRKKALMAADGPLRTPFALRHRCYDLAMDASNPTDPSATQAILVRLSGARHTIGTDHPPFGRAFSAPVHIENPHAHEIDLRLALLTPLGDGPLSRRVFFDNIPALDPSSEVAAFLRDVSPNFVVINVGARTKDKMLDADAYAAIIDSVANAGFTPVITYGPREVEVARDAARRCGTPAPPTNLWELATTMAAARGVITCDTGPMHIAVGTGTPTCGIFVSTDPRRYGYGEAPHTWVELQHCDRMQWLAKICAWLETLER